jgi:histidyl-tRNA synthetase
MMMADVMEALGIRRGDYVIRVNNRKVLDGVMEAIGLGGDENAEKRLNVLRSIDKLDKFGIEGVRQLLGEGRTDESGDRTEGVGLDTEQIKTVVDFVSCKPQVLETWSGEPEFEDAAKTDNLVSAEAYDPKGGVFEFAINNTNTINSTRNILPDHELISSALDDLKNLSDIAEACGYGGRRIMIDPSVVRGLEYYTGPVFEAELMFDVTNEKGEVVQFGSVGGGGRYDGLVKRFTGQDVPATGFSIGVSRLMTALKNLGKLEDSGVRAPVLVTVMDRDALGTYQGFVQQLREAGIRAEMYQGNPNKFGKQLQYADRRGSPIAIIQGSDERANGKLQLKDLIEGRKQAEAIASNEEWRESRPGQFEIEESDLVAEVSKLLEAQKQG